MLHLLTLAALAAELPVADVASLRDAVAAALPGDVISLAPGDYTLDATLSLSVAGAPDAPITLRGQGATIRSETVEAVKISAPWWTIEGLSFVGACASDDTCEHALHIVGRADGTRVVGNTLVDFNAQLKANGEDAGAGYEWPDDVVIEGNVFYDTRPRQTANPVTKLDVVGGRRWRVEANRFSDFEKGGGDTVSYGAFLKGNGKDGVFERNLVVCSEHFAGGARVGLSFGGGGTSPDSICEDGACTPEHERGTMRNNVIVGCSDVGIYLNESADTLVVANTLYDTTGIDVRFAASTATLAGNVLDGVIRERDGGTATLGTNWEGADLDAAFADPGALDFTLVADPGLVDALDPVDGLVDDFCGAPRDATPDGGALEYATPSPCDTTVAHPDSFATAPGTDPGTEPGTDPGTDPATDLDTSAPDPADGDDVSDGCGCATGRSFDAAWLAPLLLLRRRRYGGAGGRSRPGSTAPMWVLRAPRSVHATPRSDTAS